tara:strand:- start:252746 stop:253408 length:663 start_codon:yes stop_codon:yes gene_type:complete
MGQVKAAGLGLCLLLCSALVSASSTEVSAFSVVDSATQRVMSVVAGAQEYASEDPERYYSQVQEILDPVIDFRGFARSVMGPYASSERYRSLDKEGRETLRQQLDSFTEVMRLGLVRTYSKGLLAFGGARIEVAQPPAGVSEESGRASVRQLIYTDEPEPYVVLYQMGQDKGGDWKLRNVILESVNLGEIYRNQFQAAARKYDGDLDQVIANWTTVEVQE